MNCGMIKYKVLVYMQLSNGWSFPGLVLALSTYVEQCTARLAQAARHVQKQKSSIIDDWTVFTTCLNLIQAAGLSSYLCFTEYTRLFDNTKQSCCLPYRETIL